MASLKKFLAMALLILAASIAGAQTDNFIGSGSISPFVTLGRGLSWSGSGFGTIGQNFMFNPLDPNQGFCLFLFNNNPSNAHTVTVTVAQSGDPSTKTYQGNLARWTTVPTTITFPVTVPLSSLVGINYKTTASAVIAISFTGNSSAAGTPDTVDAFTVQTSQSSCGALPVQAVQGPFQQGNGITNTQQFPVLIGGVVQPGSSSTLSGFAVGSQAHGFPLDANANTSNFFGGGATNSMSNYASPFGVDNIGNHNLLMQTVSESGFGHNGISFGFVKTNFMEVASDQLTFASTESSIPGWVAGTFITNPAATSSILVDFMANTGTASVAYKLLTLSASAAANLEVFDITTAGTTCTAVTPSNINLYSGTRKAYNAGHTLSSTCTGLPTTQGAALFNVFVPASGVVVLDLSGLIVPVGSNGGIMVENVSAVTGTVSASVTLVEQ